MAFVGPDKLVSSDNPPPSRQFIGPDQNLTVSVNNPPPEEGVVGSAVKAALAPFKGPDALINTAQTQTKEAFEGGPQPNIQERAGVIPTNYPVSTYTDPTVIDLSNAYAAGEGLAGIAKGAFGEAATRLPAAASQIESGAFKGPDTLVQPELPGVEGTESTAPQLSLERLQAAKRDPATGEVTVGHNSAAIAAQQMQMNKQAAAQKVSDFQEWLNTAKKGDEFDLGDGNTATHIGVQPGVPGAVPDTPLLDLKGPNLPPEYQPSGDLSHTVTPDTILQGKLLRAETSSEQKALIQSEIAKKGYVDSQGNFVGPEEAFNRVQGQGPQAMQGMFTEKPFATTIGGTPKLPAPENPPLPANRITLSNQDLTDINKATGTNLQPTYSQTNLPKAGESSPPIPPVPTDPIVKGFGDEMAMGKVQDRFVPGVSDMNRQFSLVATNPQTAATGALQQAKNSVTQAEVRVGSQYNNYLRKLDEFGIAPGSKESEALFHYIEGNRSSEELVNEFGKKTARNIKSEAAFMSDQYNQWLDEINEIRAGRGLAPITQRPNYINHMNQISSVGEDIVSSIKGDADLADKAQTAMAQQEQYRTAEPDVAFRHIIRKGGETAEDAVSSFRTYIQHALNYRELAPEVDRLVQMSKLAQANKMPNLSARLEDYAGYVAGKPQLLDKYFADTVGKGTASLIQKLSRNITFSVISFNPSIWAAQTIRLFPKVMLEGAGTENIVAGAKLFSSAARAEAWENVPFLQKMFQNREEAAITGGFGGSGPMQTIERVGANVPGYIDQAFAMHTAILSHDAKLAELTAKYPMSAASDLEKQAWLYAEHNIENYQALISKSATAPYFRSQTAKILTPLMREASLMTDFLYHDVLKNSGDLSRATQAARAFAGLSAMAVMGSIMEYAGGDEQKPLIGKALFPMLKAIESAGAMVKTAAAPLTAGKAYVEGKGTLGNVVKSSIKTAILARGTPGGLQVTKVIDKLFSGKE